VYVCVCVCVYVCTCARARRLDVQTWADWGVDHIVIDNCYNANSTAQSIFEFVFTLTELRHIVLRTFL
jgi:hypothetical protein